MSCTAGRSTDELAQHFLREHAAELLATPDETRDEWAVRVCELTRELRREAGFKDPQVRPVPGPNGRHDNGQELNPEQRQYTERAWTPLISAAFAYGLHVVGVLIDAAREDALSRPELRGSN